MTRKELRKKAAEMKRKFNKDYDEALEKMILSGCVDLENEPDNYALIKNFLCAFCEDTASSYGYGPRKDTKEGRRNLKEIRNIRRVI